MTTDPLVQDLVAELETIPIIDVHTHLVGPKLGARGLHDILLYHMAVSRLHEERDPAHSSVRGSLPIRWQPAI